MDIKLNLSCYASIMLDAFKDLNYAGLGLSAADVVSPQTVHRKMCACN